MGGTLIRDGHTNPIRIEHPVLRAFQTHLPAPVPSATTDIRHFLDGSFDAFSVDKVIAVEAAEALSFIVVRSALI